MIHIKKLLKFTMDDEKSFGLNGFITKEIYEVSKQETNDEISISLKLKKLEESLTIEWPHLENDIKWYNELIDLGFSFGAYDNEILVGVIIVEKREWNNSFWIADIIVSKGYRGNGIGSLLIEKLDETALSNQVRIIALETQSNNLPAISFYKKRGFELDGIDLSLYTNRDIEKKKVAIYMKKKLD